MRFLYAAVVAFLVPIAVMAGFGLAVGVPARAFADQIWPAVTVGLLAAAPFLMMAAARRRSRGERLAVAAGLVLTVLPWIVLVLDTVTAPAGRGANIGLGIVMLFWPLVVFAAMYGLSFVPSRLDPDTTKSDVSPF